MTAMSALQEVVEKVYATPADVLDQTRRFVHRYVVLSDAQATASALWVAHTHAFEAFDVTPYLSVTSALMRSGKTRLLEVFELLVAKPLPAANISDAALFRAVKEMSPTLLFDEVDAIFGKKARDREDLRGMINAGHRKGASVYRMGGPKMTELQDFPVFCAKAFAGIGDLPNTVTDRSILIRLERRTKDEPVERFRRRAATEAANGLRDQLAAIFGAATDDLHDARPALPEGLDDRAEDVWEPLLAIADLAGGDWTQDARDAALVLSGPDARQDDENIGVQLLEDICTVFESGVEHFKTADLAAALCALEESPWGDWNGSKGFTSHALARLLRPHRIKTMTVWVDGQAVKGYKAEQFTDAFHRVLGVRGVRKVRSESPSQKRLTEPNSLEIKGLGQVRPEPASDAGSNPPNPPNPSPAWGEQGRANVFAPATLVRDIPDAEVRRLLEQHRPDLIGRNDLLTAWERRQLAATYLLAERNGTGYTPVRWDDDLNDFVPRGGGAA